ncbi:Cro/CI family transcriptional regulator [Pseudomonas sp. 5P_3.1_Bac2]|uniref:Cro/CI family transcriptional regulator n=1 Tax=Pseudomonas sp. 5P_3.1_Bac2 TaxID=2971617 RepID=UPI0021C6F441|nr:Cro/CI family transcriptional regulator [Pseudomonas sp. 5P_3.1_Bac2]MCU1717340.1 Cro/CI family transcriptional regulator [Pseudomonas sp. 5P_3.1_Bac2]
MKKTPLPELVERLSQSVVAKALGVSAPAISKALKAERDISVTEHADGSLTAVEIRPFPHQSQDL